MPDLSTAPEQPPYLSLPPELSQWREQLADTATREHALWQIGLWVQRVLTQAGAEPRTVFMCAGVFVDGLALQYSERDRIRVRFTPMGRGFFVECGGVEAFLPFPQQNAKGGAST